jgi:hypothetical protein
LRLSDVVSVVREYGLRWLMWRMWYELQLRRGFRQGFPEGQEPSRLLSEAVGIAPETIDEWLTQAWEASNGKFFLARDIREHGHAVHNPDQVLQRAEQVLQGRFLYFSRWERKLGNPPIWFTGAKEGAYWPDQVHWSRITDLSPDLGDIKYVWEPARFGHVFTLARAYAITGDERFPETFWTHVESWVSANLPQMGPHWRCAQEMSLRSMAWIFGLYAFRQSPSSTPERVALLLKQVWYHACNVEKLHWYAAECVKNNHAISEAAFLHTVGSALPFLPHAARWRTKGIQYLAHELSWQVYDDGTYIQHSMNYARFVVQILTWAISVAAANAAPLPPIVEDRAKRLLEFMVAMQDPESGRVPNYGSNDGALIFPLTSCDYLDYRPALQALGVALGQPSPYGPGAWDEEATWFTAGRPLIRRVPEHRRSQAFVEGGYYALRGTDSYGVIRCATYRHRPAQADMLHLDVWYHGHNVLIDAGTYSYNLVPPWSGYFVGTAAHNTVTVDGRDQMKKGSRFMWLHWTKSRLLKFESTPSFTTFVGEHSSYAPVIHRRTVMLEDDVYVVIDDLTGGEGTHRFRLHWLLGDFELDHTDNGGIIRLPGREDRTLQLAILAADQVQTSWARADEHSPRGWQSLYYGERIPAWSFEALAEGKSARFVTLLGPLDKVTQRLPLLASDLANPFQSSTTSHATH